MIENKKILICGGTQGIGFSLVKQILNETKASYVFATYRKESDLRLLDELKQSFSSRLNLIELDITKEESFKNLSEILGNLDFCINTIGSIDRPEKRIEDISFEKLNKMLEVNTYPSIMLFKYLKNNLRKSESPLFLVLSAKVGSIEDNKTGGWYSYRLSKAALNMALKNIYFEFKRLNEKSRTLIIHPGTTRTNLTKNFIAMAEKKYKIHTSDETANNLIKIIRNSDPKKSGQFLSWDGSQIEW